MLGKEETESGSLAWRERPFKELIRLAWPIAVSTLSYAVMTLADTLFVGRLGADALAGVGLGGVAWFTVLCFGFGALRGVKVLTSQASGAGDGSRAGVWLAGGLTLAAALSVVMLVGGYGVVCALPSLAASELAGSHAQIYMGIRLLGTPLVLAFVALREHRYGVGDTRSPMVASVAGNVLNVALDAVLIVGLDYGVAGAAASTVAGHGVELAVILLRGKGQLRLARFTRAELAELWSIGLPTGLQFWMEVGSFALLTVMISAMGVAQLAAHQIALQVLHFSFLPCVAFAEAASVLAGQAVGAGQVRLVRRVARVAAMAAGSYSATCTLILLVGAPAIARAFTDDAALVAITVQLLWMATVFQIADGAATVARGVLRGTGDVKFPAAVGIATAWICTPPLAWLLGHVAGLGALGGWIGLGAEIIAAALIFWWRLERAGWLGHARRARQKAIASRLQTA